MTMIEKKTKTNLKTMVRSFRTENKTMIKHRTRTKTKNKNPPDPNLIESKLQQISSKLMNNVYDLKHLSLALSPADPSILAHK